jgi:hypothetical protein
MRFRKSRAAGIAPESLGRCIALPETTGTLNRF